jgi:hypothetical protein
VGANKKYLFHVLASEGCFYGNGMFRVAPRFVTKHLEEIFRHKVFKMLLSKGKITEDLVNLLLSWPPAETMTPYHVRGRLYIPEESKLSYQSKACPRPRSGNGKEEKVFDALDPALLNTTMLIVR